ncbi:hypothetical protein [Arundinibacter roseus]|uniref:Uncharacterized protein n=1 Tax=Arundinibacter roseus TaxID=2070510 RepID=A0A4R4K7N7_9BACT|nr:hypothetical protein [Arundinibacter roseus]TDB63373.1 hypothetical protein EZE20_16515 [Arundinibacter roseus]
MSHHSRQVNGLGLGRQCGGIPFLSAPWAVSAPWTPGLRGLCLTAPKPPLPLPIPWAASHSPKTPTSPSHSVGCVSQPQNPYFPFP